MLSYEYSESLNSAGSNNATNVTAEEAEAKHFLAQISPRLEALNTEQVNATWKFNTDISSENEAKLVSVILKLSIFNFTNCFTFCYKASPNC